MAEQAGQGQAGQGQAGQGQAGQGQAVEPSGYAGGNPATAGKGEPKVESVTPENEEGKLNPSAPGNAGTTPGTTGGK